MDTTEKQISTRLTKEDSRLLVELQKQFGENRSQIIKRALLALYLKYIDKEQKS